MIVELKRVKDVGDFPHQVECVVCHKEITLYYNGGELDQEQCCNHIYYLENTQIDFIIERKF